MKTVSLVGSTGSIGTQAIDVICAEPGLATGWLPSGRPPSVDALAAQAELLRPERVALADPGRAGELRGPAATRRRAAGRGRRPWPRSPPAPTSSSTAWSASPACR